MQKGRDTDPNIDVNSHDARRFNPYRWFQKHLCPSAYGLYGFFLFTKVALKSISRDVFQQEYIQSFFVGSIFKEN